MIISNYHGLSFGSELAKGGIQGVFFFFALVLFVLFLSYFLFLIGWRSRPARVIPFITSFSYDEWFWKCCRRRTTQGQRQGVT